MVIFRRPIGSGAVKGKPTGTVENKKLPASMVGGRELFCVQVIRLGCLLAR